MFAFAHFRTFTALLIHISGCSLKTESILNEKFINFIAKNTVDNENYLLEMVDDFFDPGVKIRFRTLDFIFIWQYLMKNYLFYAAILNKSLFYYLTLKMCAQNECLTWNAIKSTCYPSINAIKRQFRLNENDDKNWFLW